MNIEEYYEFCTSLKGVTEGFPFDEKVLVFKVMGKMFALTDVESFEFINLKCDPDKAIELRERHPEIRPGWHMNKTHWNSVYPDGDLDDDLIRELILHSYELIVKSLPRKKREELNG